MAAKQLVFSEDARRKLKNGMNVVANAVSATLGPKGRNVAVDRKFGSPTITHDGVSVAKEIELEDPFENMGAQLLKEAASKTNDIAGDGTTTSTVLAHAIVNEGLRALEAGYNPMLLKYGIMQATETVVEELRKMSVKIDSKEEIASVGGCSSALYTTLALCSPKAMRNTRRASRIVATPIVTAWFGTFSSPKNPLAASRRVMLSSVTVRVRLFRGLPGSLNPMWPVRPIPRI